MNKVSKILTALAAVATMAVSAEAETAVWSVKPSYEHLDHLSGNLYIGTLSGKAFIIHADDGGVINTVPRVDSITPVSEGKSLLLIKAPGDKMQLTAIIGTDGNIVPVSDELFVNDFAYFSDGMCPVYDKDDLYGYINERGVLVLPCTYYNIHPFRDGYASVTKRKKGLVGKVLNAAQDAANSMLKKRPKVEYIDKAGKTLKLSKEIGGVVVGSTFDGGKAYVENEKGGLYVINTEGRIVSRMGIGSQLDFDEDYVVVNDRDENAGTHAQAQAAAIPFEKDGRYGYKTPRGAVVLPVQFSEAEPFDGRYALACVNNRWGLLRLEQGSVSCNTVQKAATRKTKRTPAHPATTQYTFALPNSLSSAALTFTMRPAGGQAPVTEQSESGNTRVFTIDKPTGEYLLTLATPDLVLWAADHEQDMASVTTGSASSLRIRVTSSAKADKNDNAAIAVTFSNPTDEAVTFDAKVSGQSLSPVSKSITVPARSSRTVYTKFTKVLEPGKRSVMVQADGRTTYRSVSLTPFFIAL